jgi:hypothetical protein
MCPVIVSLGLDLTCYPFMIDYRAMKKFVIGGGSARGFGRMIRQHDLDQPDWLGDHWNVANLRRDLCGVRRPVHNRGRAAARPYRSGTGSRCRNGGIPRGTGHAALQHADCGGQRYHETRPRGSVAQRTRGGVSLSARGCCSGLGKPQKSKNYKTNPNFPRCEYL